MIPQDKIDLLRGELGGFVLQPGEPGYRKAVTIDNGRIHRPPAAIVFPYGIEDIRRTVRFVRDNDVPFTIKGGGHSATGYCLNRGGLVLDMSTMNLMKLDAERQILRVQTGVTWQDVYNFMQQSGTGLIPVGGGCLSVGIPGFILGGGIGFASRSYGMSIDNLLSLTLVTAEGEVKRLSANSTGADADLFWACRGGGGGNFGIAVEVEVRVHQPNSPTLLGGEIYYSLDRIEEILGFYNEWILTVPDTLAVYGLVGNLSLTPTDSVKAIRFEPVFNGPFEEGLELIQPLLKLNPISVTLDNVTLIDFENIMGNTTAVGGQNAYIRSGTMRAGSLTPEVARILKTSMIASPSPASFALWIHAGGKMSEVSSTATAYPHRDAEFVFELKSIWETQEETRRNVEWGYHFVEQLQPSFTGAYVNYIDPLLQSWQERYYGENYPRLLRVKEQVDPDRFFRFQQGIGSPFSPPGGEPLDLSPLNRTFLP
ncbi:MAG TPA: FAD-binding oxidoreductase [Thermoanaerobaculia bacterium]|nr:FAD-binding oxidoreductase [Thermoanaerobaculia bacterium]